VHDFATGHKLLYVILLLGPFLGLFVREPLLFLGALPDLAINLPSSAPDQTSIAYHWTAGIIPFTVAASILGLARSRRDRDQISLWVLAATMSIALFSPVLLARNDLAAVLSPNRTHDAKAAALKFVPVRVPVAASNQLGTYLSARRYTYTLPIVGKARWAVIDPGDPSYADKAGYQAFVRKLERNKAWRLVFASHGIEVLHKIGG
jgi:uncharacterized membrane protein